MNFIELLSTGLSKLVWSAVKSHVDFYVKDFLAKRRVERAVHEAVDRVVVELEQFLTYELPQESLRALIVETALHELETLTNNPSLLFKGSLDAHRIFEQLYPNSRYPEAIVQERLESVWGLFVPRVVALLCKLAGAIEEWRVEGWREGFRRLDEVAQGLAKLQADVDSMVRHPVEHSDSLFERVRRFRRQYRELSIDVTGLGGDAPITAQLDAMFVHPGFAEKEPYAGGERREIQDAEHCIAAMFGRTGRAYVEAGAGAGKTTWTKWIQRQLEKGKEPVIVTRIELRQHSSGLPSIQEVLKTEAGPHLSDELDAKTLRMWFEKGRVHVIVDGMDELAGDAREAAHEWVLALAATMSTGAIVLTSRPLTTDHLSRLAEVGWDGWNLLSFDQTRVCEYIQKWYKFAPLLPDAERDVNAQELADSWVEDPTLQALTGNPLLLSTLLTVHHLDGRLPPGRARLYQRYIDGMLGTWDARRKVSTRRTQLDSAMQRRVLRDIAIYMNVHGRDALDDEDVTPVVGKTLLRCAQAESAADVLALLRERSGLLVGPGTWSFAHKSIGEYLLAEAIVDGNLALESGERLDRMWLYTRRRNDRYGVVLFLWAGIVPVTGLEEMIALLLEGGIEDQLLGFGLAEDQFERLSPSMWPEIAQRLIELPRDDEHRRDIYWVFPLKAPTRHGTKSQVIHDLELRTGQLSMPSISGDSDTGRIVLRLAGIGVIRWEDVAVRQGPVRDYLWLVGREPAAWCRLDAEDAPAPPNTDISERWWLQAAWFAMVRKYDNFASMPEQLNAIVARLRAQSLLGYAPVLLVVAALEADAQGRETEDYIRCLSNLTLNEDELRLVDKIKRIEFKFGEGWTILKWEEATHSFFDLIDRLDVQGRLLPAGIAAGCRRCFGIDANQKEGVQVRGQ